MNGNDDLRRQNEALRRRISQLSAASLRIGASLDLDTVLGEIVESARALTGARYAGIATIDESGKPVDFVTSGFPGIGRRLVAGIAAPSEDQVGIDVVAARHNRHRDTGRVALSNDPALLVVRPEPAYPTPHRNPPPIVSISR